VAAGFLAIALAGSVAGCATLGQYVKAPELSFDRAEFVAASFQDIRVDLVFDLHNPNPIGLKLDGYAMKFVIDGLTLIDGVVDQELDMRGGKTTKLVIPAKLAWTEVFAKVTGGFSKDEMPFQAAGDARVNTPVGQIKLPYDVKGALPVIKPPKILPTDLRVGKASLSGVSLEIDLAVDNPMSRAIGVIGFAPKVTLADQVIATAKLSDTMKVGAKSKGVHTMKVNLSSADVGMALIKALTGSSKVKVGVSGGATIDTGIGKIPLSFNESKSL
jgi:LEA14-like dessication related protein